MNLLFVLLTIITLGSAGGAAAQADAEAQARGRVASLTDAEVRTAAQQMAASLDQRLGVVRDRASADVVNLCNRAKTAATNVTNTPRGQANVALGRYRVALRAFVRASSALADVENSGQPKPEQLVVIASGAMRRFSERVAVLRELVPDRGPALDQVEMLLATAANALELAKPQDAVASLRSARTALLDLEEAAGL